MKYKEFTTNCGLCFLFETKEGKLIFVTSDIGVMHQQIFDGDSELLVGRVLKIDSNNYKITHLFTYSNLQTTSDFQEQSVGKVYPYSHVLKIIVQNA